MLDSSNIVNGRKLYWSEVRLNLEVLQKFDIRKFPFDKQNIILGLEFTYNDPKILKINLSKKVQLHQIQFLTIGKFYQAIIP